MKAYELIENLKEEDSQSEVVLIERWKPTIFISEIVNFRRIQLNNKPAIALENLKRNLFVIQTIVKLNYSLVAQW